MISRKSIMDYYESWESFVSNIDVVPDKLDGKS